MKGCLFANWDIEASLAFWSEIADDIWSQIHTENMTDLSGYFYEGWKHHRIHGTPIVVLNTSIHGGISALLSGVWRLCFFVTTLAGSDQVYLISGCICVHGN